MEYNGANNPPIEAVKSFIDKLNLTTDQAGIIRWDDTIESTARLSFNKAELNPTHMKLMLGEIHL